MSLWKRRGWFWADFSIDGTRYRKPLKTRNWQEAKKTERQMVEAARAGHLETKELGENCRAGKRATQHREEALRGCEVGAHYARGDCKLSTLTSRRRYRR